MKNTSNKHDLELKRSLPSACGLPYRYIPNNIIVIYNADGGYNRNIVCPKLPFPPPFVHVLLKVHIPVSVNRLKSINC